MENVLIISLLIITLTPLFSEELTLAEKMELAKEDWKKLSYELYISPLVVANAGIALTQRKKLKKSYNEASGVLYADIIPQVDAKDNSEFYKINLWGAKFKSTYFYKPDFSGFNWFFNFGFQSIYIYLPFDPGGPSSQDPDWILFPDIAVGCGYSWKLKNDDHLRISLDAGLKFFISNLYISYVW